ncbi:MAG TPA: tetratricopeptide repeat protein [Blastocatellia bacterium]|nr:tetratricopeptide repeat protein [Blastocatellia bacterium]
MLFRNRGLSAICVIRFGVFSGILWALLVASIAAKAGPLSFNGALILAGTNQLHGIIYLPGGQRANRRMKVVLSSNHAGDQFTMSDDNGAFTFSSVRSGRYEIRVDAGNDFESLAENVDVEDTSQNITVHINLKIKRAVRESPGTVDASRPSAQVPKKAQDLYQSAVKSADSGDINNSIEKLKRAISIYPDYGDAYNELGVDYLKLKQTDQAISVLQSAIKFLPQNYAPHLNYGIALIRQRGYAESLVELKLASQLNPISPLPHLYQGRALIGLNKYDEAEKELQKSLRMGGSPEAHRFLGFIYTERNDKKQAIDELEAYLKLSPGIGDEGQIRGIISDLRKK